MTDIPDNPYRSPKESDHRLDAETSPLRWRQVIAAAWVSLFFAAALLCLDVVVDGDYLFSILVCPIWLMASVVKNLIGRPGWRIALFRVAIPAVTLGIVLANTAMQWDIGDANGERVVKACEDFHVDNGQYPKTLDELVPRYLPSVPRAKYSLDGKFWYYNHGSGYTLCWVKIGFCRKVYSSETEQWRHLD